MARDKYEERYDLLTRGVGPHGSVGAESVGWSGGKCSTTMYSRRLGPYFGELKDGGVVVDKWTVDFKTGYNLVVHGPMVDVTLPPKTIDKFDGQISDVMLIGLQGSFQAMALKKRTDPKWSGLDSVSLDLYCDLWRQAGARIGKRIGNEIHWEDGAVSEIPDEAHRYLPDHEADAVLHG